MVYGDHDIDDHLDDPEEQHNPRPSGGGRPGGGLPVNNAGAEKFPQVCARTGSRVGVHGITDH